MGDGRKGVFVRRTQECTQEARGSNCNQWDDQDEWEALAIQEMIQDSPLEDCQSAARSASRTRGELDSLHQPRSRMEKSTVGVHLPDLRLTAKCDTGHKALCPVSQVADPGIL